MTWTDNYGEEGEKGRKYDLDRCEKQKMVQIRKKYEEDGSTEKKRTIKEYNRDKWSNHKYISEGLVSWLSRGKPSRKEEQHYKKIN